MKALVKKLFGKKEKSVYDARIFQYQPWLTKQVNEALYKRAFGLD